MPVFPLVGSTTVAPGRSVPRLQLAADLLQAFEACYRRFLREGFRSLREDWLNAADMIGKPASVALGDDVYRGVVETVGEDGALVLRDGRGEVRRMTIGDATILKDGH